MVLLPRNPVNQNPLHKHDASSGVANAGSIVALNSDGEVAKVATSGQAPYGILFQKVKGATPGLPQNFEFPGELGNSDARLGDPVLIYQDGGTFETDNYYLVGSGIAAGTKMYAIINDVDKNGMLTDDDGSTLDVADNGDGSTAAPVALAIGSLTDTEADAKDLLFIKLLI